MKIRNNSAAQLTLITDTDTQTAQQIPQRAEADRADSLAGYEIVEIRIL